MVAQIQTNGLFARLREQILNGDNPLWFVPYLKLERKATSIMDFSAGGLIGLLQTPDYARAIFRAGLPRASPDVIENKVMARLARCEVLDGPTPLMLWAVIHEACLRTLVGGPTVMANQLDHLVEVAESHNVDFQVLPFSAGAMAAHLLPFTLLTFAKAPAVLYTDDPQEGRIFQAPDVVASFTEKFGRLRSHALAPDDSLAFVAKLSKEYR